MSSQLYAISLMLIMTIGPLPDATGRHETGDSPRQNALDPGFHRARTGQQSYYALDPGIHYVRTRWIRRFIASERTGSGISSRSDWGPEHPNRDADGVGVS